MIRCRVAAVAVALTVVVAAPLLSDAQQALGLAIPQTLLLRANHIIE